MNTGKEIVWNLVGTTVLLMLLSIRQTQPVLNHTEHTAIMANPAQSTPGYRVLDLHVWSLRANQKNLQFNSGRPRREHFVHHAPMKSRLVKQSVLQRNSAKWQSNYGNTSPAWSGPGNRILIRGPRPAHLVTVPKLEKSPVRPWKAQRRAHFVPYVPMKNQCDILSVLLNSNWRAMKPYIIQTKHLHMLEKKTFKRGKKIFGLQVPWLRHCDRNVYDQIRYWQQIDRCGHKPGSTHVSEV